MKSNRFGAALSVLVAGAVTLSACGRDDNAASQSPTSDTVPVVVSCGGKPSVKASGSTAQENAMTLFARAFEQACPGQSLTYTANSSAEGISEFIDDKTDFGGSDSPLSQDEHAKAEQRCGSPVWNLPMVFGPVAIAFNVPGLTTLNLDAPTAARIFNGTITSWHDPAIHALNPGASLPIEPIRVVYRRDRSGTTENFQRYLDSASNGAWGRGAGKEFNGGVGEGVESNEEAAALVHRTEGAISYVEWSYALEEHLSMASVFTSAGPRPVPISTESVGKTISAAWFIGEGNDLAFDTISFFRPNQPGSYPIVLVSYQIVCSKYRDAQVGTAVKALLQSAVDVSQKDLAHNGYVPVPDAFMPRLLASIDAIS
ncbi:phosphate ABC transporter substrate-binding protein PstS [Mycobacterium spongiae]|uniref:Phosphate-binding protein n=1 Tax=Mycobacterium spongiae TaxID=886343 RepID=A0A975PWA5_9MYCO|nr:phosphate ABC transporter substrate-binding protein PstS [Mycobacterium spongiae]QUR66584.1 phosphate ABC transporter substrate-binding protein PstS [Mycobacterium spongiae]